MLKYYQVVHKGFQRSPGNLKLFAEYVEKFHDDAYENFGEAITRS